MYVSLYLSSLPFGRISRRITRMVWAGCYVFKVPWLGKTLEQRWWILRHPWIANHWFDNASRSCHKGVGLVPLSCVTGISSLSDVVARFFVVSSDRSSKFVCVEFVSGRSMCWPVGMPADVGGLWTFANDFLICFEFRL
jgi:hypothetical protein